MKKFWERSCGKLSGPGLESERMSKSRNKIRKYTVRKPSIQNVLMQKKPICAPKLWYLRDKCSFLRE